MRVSYEEVVDDNNESILLKTTSDDSDLFEEIIEREEELKNVFTAIEKLKPSYQYIIIETEIYGRTFKDIAEEWNEPIGTLLSRKNRAIHQLRKLINQKNQHYET